MLDCPKLKSFGVCEQLQALQSLDLGISEASAVGSACSLPSSLDSLQKHSNGHF